MACIEQKTDFNFLNWHKVVGSYTLSDLQASGVPSVCDNITPEAQGWNISTAVFLQDFSVATQDTFSQGMFFNDTGYKMYVVGIQNDKVYEYDLSTAYNITSSVYIQEFSVASQDTSPVGVYFNSLGSKMFMIGTTGKDVNQYDLSTPWDISGDSVSFNQLFSISANETAPTDVFFNPDGDKMYVLGLQNHKVCQYDLSTPWDISGDSVSFNQLFSLSGQMTSPQGMFFNPNGNQLFVVGQDTETVFQYSLSNWDISTISLVSSFDVSTQDNTPTDISFNPDGSSMYVIGRQNNKIYQYSL